LVFTRAAVTCNSPLSLRPLKFWM